MYLTKFYAEFSTFHYVSYKNSVRCRLLVFAHLHNSGPLQCKQVYKTTHKLVLAEISDFLAADNV